MTREMLDRFYVELTNPDELGLTDSRVKAMYELAIKGLQPVAPEEQRNEITEGAMFLEGAWAEWTGGHITDHQLCEAVNDFVVGYTLKISQPQHGE